MAVSDKPWGQFTDADYSDAGDYCDASLINENTGPRSTWTKGACHLRVREPNGGSLNRNGVHAAAQRLMQTNVSPELRRSAARKLVTLYGQLGEEAPEVVKRIAQ